MSDKVDLEFNKNEDAYKTLVANLNDRLNKIYEGGGKKSAAKQKEKNKMLARERVAYLLDKNSLQIEVGAFAADGMYPKEGGCPSAGVVVVIGYIEGRQCIVVANDATVKAGAWFPMTAKKNLRAQEIAIENKLPIVYLVDSAGVFLPMQDEIFPDKEHFGRIFRNNAVMSSMGIIQIAAIMGSCVAGGAYLPIMSDEAMIVDKTGSVFLAGSYLVKSAIGEDIDNETLGGASTHCEISGVTDKKFADDTSCLDYIKRIFSKLGAYDKAGFDRVATQPPIKNIKDVYGMVATDNSKQYDVREIITRITDNSGFDEYKDSYGQTIVCGTARVDGWAVGFVANQRKIVTAKKPGNSKEMQLGGVIYSDSADKAARFIMNCNQRKIPLVFLQDVTGFMVGSRSEQGGIIKDGAKLVNAMANSVVPKFTIVIGNSYGAGNYAMCGKAYDPRLMIGWPTAQIAVMGGAQAAKTLLQIQVAALKAQGKELTKEEEAEQLKIITDRYNSQISPYYAASRLWLDAVIDPAETRKIISMGIEMSNHAPLTKQYNVGVIQT
ncbi:MAG TPA: carboxyl transferase domain-containing protein [Bacteroidia bacterium]|nr:carboxyl transferase domain-containing protein [Bacteroidia bacterium]HNU33960.1 carboxyl transferase domain-containing protein [Bacteroidia bacterium]